VVVREGKVLDHTDGCQVGHPFSLFKINKKFTARENRFFISVVVSSPLCDCLYWYWNSNSSGFSPYDLPHNSASNTDSLYYHVIIVYM